MSGINLELDRFYRPLNEILEESECVGEIYGGDGYEENKGAHIF